MLAPLPIPPDYSEGRRLEHEIEILGFPLSRHPIALFRPFLKGLHYVQARDMRRYIGQHVTMIGWLITSKLVRTKKGQPMEFVSFEDTTGLYDTTFFPETYRRFGHMLSSDRPHVLEGILDEEFGAMTLTVHKVRIPSRPQVATCS